MISTGSLATALIIGTAAFVSLTVILMKSKAKIKAEMEKIHTWNQCMKMSLVLHPQSVDSIHKIILPMVTYETITTAT